MKIVSPPNPSPVQTYPTKEAALAVDRRQGIRHAKGPALRRTRRQRRQTGTQPPDKKPKQFVVVESPAVVDGSELRDASASQGRGGAGEYQINVLVQARRGQKFGDWTGKNINNYMAVVLNDEVKSAAYIKSQIFDSGEISGKFTKDTADDLALTLKSGALPAAIEYQEERTVGPSLGADSIRAGVTLGRRTGFIILFMLFYYRGAGINAVSRCALNMILTVAALISVRLDADAARHRRPDPRHRYGRRLERADLRAHS